MSILVYWESIVWITIANGVVYVKYKRIYSTKLLVLNCLVFLASSPVSAIIPKYGAADGQ